MTNENIFQKLGEILKPEPLGLNSFNWSPSSKSWQRKITANAMYSVKHMLTGIKKVS